MVAPRLESPEGIFLMYLVPGLVKSKQLRAGTEEAPLASVSVPMWLLCGLSTRSPQHSSFKVTRLLVFPLVQGS